MGWFNISLIYCKILSFARFRDYFYIGIIFFGSDDWWISKFSLMEEGEKRRGEKREDKGGGAGNRKFLFFSRSHSENCEIRGENVSSYEAGDG